MEHQVFISYSVVNKKDADTVCSYLEQRGIRCWIAPRDIPQGHFVEAIADAIRRCKALVLVFSSSANKSVYVPQEVQYAFDHEVPIVPFKLDNAPYSKRLDFLVGSVHWVNGAIPPKDAHLEELFGRVSALLGAASGEYWIPEQLNWDTTYVLIKRAALSEKRDRIVEHLIEAASGSERRRDATERYWAYIALGEIGSDEALAAVREGADSEDDEWARQGAREALEANS